MTPQAQTIDSWLTTHAAHQPDKAALVFEGSTCSYRALQAWVLGLTGWLADQGVARGDRIALYGQNSATQVAMFFAAARLGAMVVPLNWRLAPSELTYILANCSPTLLIYGESVAAAVPEVTAGLVFDTVAEAEVGTSATRTEPAALSDPFLIVYTSGTTGRPKGAVLTQEAVFWNAVISGHAHDFTATDHVLNILPLFHVGGINIQMMPTFFYGGTVTLHPSFDPGRTLDAMQAGGITSTVCVPTVMRALMAHPDWPAARFPDLRMLNTGSTDVPVDILADVNGRGIPMVQVYGATETGPIAMYQRAAEAAATMGSIGRPAAHCQIRLVASDGTESAQGVPGEIWVKGPNMFTGYWQDSAATAAAVEDGWFKTGDVAWRDAGGLYWFVGRVKHVIISGGENIYPAELERIYAQLPGVTEVSVVGRPDPKWGEVPVVAAVVAPDGPSRDDLLAACDSHIARFKRPKDVILVEALPKNALGKVLVDAVRAMVV